MELRQQLLTSKLEEIEEIIQNLTSQIAEIAREDADQINGMHKLMRSDKEQAGLIGVNVKNQKNGVGIYWFKYYFVGAPGKRRSLRRHISLPRTGRYRPSSFEGYKLKEWERDELEVREELYVKLRKLTKLNEEIINSVGKAKKLLTESNT